MRHASTVLTNHKANPFHPLEIVRYIYKNEMITDLCEVYATYMAADRYSITKLTKELLKFCTDSLTIENSTIIYDQYLQIEDRDERDLQNILDVICPHAFLAFQSIQFLQIRKDTLTDLLDNDMLFISEKELYLRCLCWVNAELERRGLETNKKNKLNLFNELKHLIRFPIMLQKQVSIWFDFVSVYLIPIRLSSRLLNHVHILVLRQKVKRIACEMWPVHRRGTE